MSGGPIIEEITDGDDTDTDVEEETLAERICALSEMFPESMRKGASSSIDLTVNGVKSLYYYSGRGLWLFCTSFVILALPVLFEVERIQAEEQQLQQQRQILLGPGAATPGLPGSAPPPPRR